jgi:hypothetical protein
VTTRIRDGRPDFHSRQGHIQTATGTHPASYPMATMGSFPYDEAATIHLHLTPMLGMRRARSPLPHTSSRLGTYLSTGTLRFYFSYTRAVCKVRGLAAARRCYAEGGLTLLLRVGTLWRCGDGLFFEKDESTTFSNGPRSCTVLLKRRVEG